MDGVSGAIDTLVCVFLSEGRATTVGGMPSACVASAACSGSATAAFPVGRKVKTHNPTGLGNECASKTICPASRCQM